MAGEVILIDSIKFKTRLKIVADVSERHISCVAWESSRFLDPPLQQHSIHLSERTTARNINGILCYSVVI